jgi:hypothetical protein
MIWTCAATETSPNATAAVTTPAILLKIRMCILLSRDLASSSSDAVGWKFPDRYPVCSALIFTRTRPPNGGSFVKDVKRWRSAQTAHTTRRAPESLNPRNFRNGTHPLQ